MKREHHDVTPTSVPQQPQSKRHRVSPPQPLLQATLSPAEIKKATCKIAFKAIKAAHQATVRPITKEQMRALGTIIADHRAGRQLNWALESMEDEEEPSTTEEFQKLGRFMTLQMLD